MFSVAAVGWESGDNEHKSSRESGVAQDPQGLLLPDDIAVSKRGQECCPRDVTL